MSLSSLKLLPLVLATALTAPARAAENMCASLAKIQNQQESCDDNSQLSAAAETCLRGFKKRVDAEQPRLQKLLLKNTAGALTDKSGATARQEESEALSASAYDTTVKALDDLILKGTLARAEVEAYRRNLVWPFIWSEGAFGGAPRPDPDDPDVHKAIDEEFCYGEHSDIIIDARNDFDKMLNELKASRAAAATMQAQSTGHETNLKGTLGAPAATGGKKSAAPGTNYKGNYRPGQSDISGTKEEEKKGK